MKTIFYATYYFFGWLIYFLFTTEERTRYMSGKSKGYHCYKVEHHKGFLAQSSDLYFDRNTKPKREYITWKEFWKTRKHWNK